MGRLKSGSWGGGGVYEAQYEEWLWRGVRVSKGDYQEWEGCYPWTGRRVAGGA